jgi:hypothetical protein
MPDRRFKTGVAANQASMAKVKPLVPQAAWNPLLTLMMAKPTAPSPPAATAPPPPPPAATAPAGGAPAGGDDHETEVRRKHRRVVALPNLPKGFTVGEAVLGRHRTANERMDRNYVPNAPVPVVNVDSETERMPSPEVTVTLADDERPFKCHITFNARQTLKLKDYATNHCYQTDKGTHALQAAAPALQPRLPVPLPCPGAARRLADELNAP